MALSPDGRRLAVQRGVADDRDLWVKDLTTGVFSRVTSTPGPERNATWSPDSRRLVYGRDDGDQPAIFETLLGSGKHTRIPSDSGQSGILGWTPDARFLLTGGGGTGSTTVNLLPMPDDGTPSGAAAKPQRLFTESYITTEFAISPNGKWVAYASQENGQPEITVATFPGLSERRQLSPAGGTQPLWRSDGGELFYIARDQKLMAISVKSGTTLEFGPAKALFQTAVGTGFVNRTYAVTPDGQRFLVREAGTANVNSIEQLYVVTNWPSLVR
jgi:Tol biopolymer transport system component